jgi:transposase InsO family protein
MAKTIKEERLRWILPIVNKEMRLCAIAKVCPYSKRSLERWIAIYKQFGEESLEPKSTRPKTSPKETPIRIKEEIIALRKKTSLCAKKLYWELKERGVPINERTIGKIIKREKLTRTYRKKKIKYKYLKALLKPGELVEIDVKYVPGRVAGRRYFQYTAIDCASRWRYLAVYDNETKYHSILFLKEVINRFPYHLEAIKTDNGAIFTNYYNGLYKRSDNTVKTLHALDAFCAENDIIHYLIDPGKPAQNGKVERSHRSDQERFYDRNNFNSFFDLQIKLMKWNIEYNNLRHCGLDGISPNKYLANYSLTNPPNVCA